MQILDVDMWQQMLCKRVIATARLQKIAMHLHMRACMQVALWTASPVKAERCTRNSSGLHIMVHQELVKLFFNG